MMEVDSITTLHLNNEQTTNIHQAVVLSARVEGFFLCKQTVCSLQKIQIEGALCPLSILNRVCILCFDFLQLN